MNSGGAPAGTGSGAARSCGTTGAGDGATGVTGTRGGAGRTGRRADGAAAVERRLDSPLGQHVFVRARGRRTEDSRERDWREPVRGRIEGFVF
jgi:hypothetical protein